MTTFAYEVSPYRREDGTQLIKLRLTHRRKVLRKPTTFYARRDQLSRDGRRVRDAALLEAIDRHLSRLRLAVGDIDGAEWMDAERLWQCLTAREQAEKGFRLDVFEYAATITATMERGTADGYRYALNALRRYLGRDNLDINEIDHALLVGFRDDIERRNGKGCRAASRYLGCLRHIHNRARADFNDEDLGVVRIPRQPFKRGLVPSMPLTKPRALTLEQLRAVIDVQPVKRRERLAKDVFLLSFALVGCNTADLYSLRRGDLRDGVITYRRAKTDSVRADGAAMRVKVEREAAEIIDRYRGSGSSLLSFCERYSDFKAFNSNVNKGLKGVAALAGLATLTTYHARHTWATLARNACGVDYATVHEALNHAARGGDKVTDIYIERDFSRVWEANRKVLDLVFSR